MSFIMEWFSPTGVPWQLDRSLSFAEVDGLSILKIYHFARLTTQISLNGLKTLKSKIKLKMNGCLLLVTTFPYSELLQHLFYSLLRSDCSQLIIYDILTVLSVSSTADFPLIDYFSHNDSS